MCTQLLGLLDPRKYFFNAIFILHVTKILDSNNSQINLWIVLFIQNELIENLMRKE